MNSQREHWEETAETWRQERRHKLWRQHSDSVNLSLVKDWWPENSVRNVLKTDLFDEAFGTGLYPFIRSNAEFVSGIDISQSIVSQVRSRCPGLQSTVADVRRTPFRNDSFDLVISNSTLDHFQVADDISVALQELHRVLRPGGQLVLTMDNLRNPLIVLRNNLPFRMTTAVGVVPYFVGPTFGPVGLRQAAVQTGFQVIDTASIMHCPRVAAVALAGLLQRYAKHALQQRYIRLLRAFEKLSVLPTHSFTGHFVAVRLVK